MYRGSSITPRDLECMLCDETAEPKALPLSLLEGITNGFSDEQKIGRGGFADVYKGKLKNKTVAVKRMLSNTYMYETEFQREVECLMMVKHRNVVRFLGYCADTQGTMAMHEGKYVMADVQQRLLCFEYLPNGSLHEYITDSSSRLQWRDRYRIINGICHGLRYLHQNKIVHLDLKPGNILLDANLVAKIADFGLSRCFHDKSRVITLKIGGTMGYLAPEYCNGEITYLFDIYSLGVMIMEILTGKKGYHAVDKVVESWSGILEESQSEVLLKQVRVCAEIGIECIDANPAKRPDAQHIIDRLDETESMEENIETGRITSQQRPIKPGSVQLVMRNKNTVVAPLSEYKKKVMLELTGGDYTSDRLGLDLVVVLDVRGSLQGKKIDEVKTAMRFLIQKLSPMDRLSVINLGGLGLWSLQQITKASQGELQDLISMIGPTSVYGNIMEGLIAGRNALANREVHAGRVPAIMLLSGDENYCGYQEPGCDVPIYTFCYGGTANVHKALNNVTAKGMGGTFTHVVDKDTGGLTVAFSQCLAGLLTVAVQNLELTVAAVGGESTIVKVAAGSYAQEQHKDGDSVTLRFGNLYSREVRKVIVELLLPASTIHSEYTADILRVTYSHDSSAGMTKFVAPTETLTVWRTNSPEEEKPSGLLSAEEARLQMAQIIKEARTMADCKRLDDAQDKLVEARNMPSLVALRAELQELLELFKTQQTYEEQGRPYALSWESSHGRQRLAGSMRLFATPRMDKYLEQANKFLNKPTQRLPSSVDDDVKKGFGALTVNFASRKEEMRRLALDIVPVRVQLRDSDPNNPPGSSYEHEVLGVDDSGSSFQIASRFNPPPDNRSKGPDNGSKGPDNRSKGLFGMFLKKNPRGGKVVKYILTLNFRGPFLPSAVAGNDYIFFLVELNFQRLLTLKFHDVAWCEILFIF